MVSPGTPDPGQPRPIRSGGVLTDGCSITRRLSGPAGCCQRTHDRHLTTAPRRTTFGRRIAEGKAKRKAIRCLKRHLVHTIYNATTATPTETHAPTLALT
jgi:hypothetical protein